MQIVHVLNSLSKSKVSYSIAVVICACTTISRSPFVMSVCLYILLKWHVIMFGPEAPPERTNRALVGLLETLYRTATITLFLRMQSHGTDFVHAQSACHCMAI